MSPQGLRSEEVEETELELEGPQSGSEARSLKTLTPVCLLAPRDWPTCPRDKEDPGSSIQKKNTPLWSKPKGIQMSSVL